MTFGENWKFTFWGDFFSEETKKNAKTGKEFGIEGKKIDLWTPANQF